jgi:hypothetical protein
LFEDLIRHDLPVLLPAQEKTPTGRKWFNEIRNLRAIIYCAHVRVAPAEGDSMTTENTPIPVIIDTDMAPDDWMTILYLLQTPLVEVKAVTVVATGEAHARAGTGNALGL